jgi:hypothetical protein
LLSSLLSSLSLSLLPRDLSLSLLFLPDLVLF